MPLKSRTTGVQAPTAGTEQKPVSNRARKPSDLDKTDPSETAQEPQEAAPPAESTAPPTKAPRGRAAAAPAAEPAAPKTRAPRAAKVAADGGEAVDNPKAKLKELEAQAKQLLKDEAAAHSEVTAEFRDKRRALQNEHTRISNLVAKSIFG